ncbi:MAG: tetratricopeptide repeat protein [Sulfuricurvum sp.]|nr:tetratricopeptide repeat protein [Sulfuricurvum sp.]
MRYWIALCLWIPLSALNLSVETGKEDGNSYSVLHLFNTTPFTCQSTKNEFGDDRRIECYLLTPPKNTFVPIDNLQFKINGTNTPKGFMITVFPKSKMKLIPINFNLAKDSQTYQDNVTRTNHWTVVGFNNKIPLLTQPKAAETSINFPVKIQKSTQPYVGGLDLKGNPIKIARVQDVTDYMEMKKAYTAKDYDKVLNLAEDTLKEYPKTVFKNELMFYQIRALHEKGDFEKLLEVSKQFLRDYSGDSNVAEVLADTADAYSHIGQNNDADYFYDRLFDEQSDSPYASLGMIYKAQQQEAEGSVKKSIPLYQKALETSPDIGIASRAAFKLAQIQLGMGNTDKAKVYVEKIAKGNPKYFNEVRDDAMSMMQTFVDRNDPKTASRITESLLNATQIKTSEHESLLKDLGIQLAHSGKREEALKRFNEYLKTYHDGDYADEIQHAKDGLFFDVGDMNSTAEMKKYDDLIEKYGNDSVGRKALYKKVQILLKEKKYKEILDLEGELYHLDSTEFPQTNTMISESAIGLDKEYLKEGKCAEAMNLQKMYKIRLLSDWDSLIFDCALKMAQYPAAKKIAQTHLKSKSMPERQLWLYRMVKTQFGLGEYKDAIKGGDELVTLLSVEKNPPLNDVYRILYDASQRSGNEDGMIRNMKLAEGAYGNDFKDIERYSQMVSLGLKRKDDTITQNYARKVMALQERTKTYTQSPFIEFTLAQSYQNLGKDSDALGVLKTLNKQKLSNEKRSRQQYLLGAIEQKLGHKREAQNAFNESIKADKTSAWGKLAKDALGLL